ncbi:MAG: lytic murein transglycosylase B [Neisseriaceae bacterium]|nr:lytic murein transglycosylase B [Neisseriaceae bacterium]
MKLNSLLVLAMATALSAPAWADATLLVKPEVQSFIEQKVLSKEYTRAELEGFFTQTVHKPSIIAAMDRPGTSRPWYEFKKNNLGAKKIQEGVRFWQRNSALLTDIARKYQVAPETIVAILGIETNYGTVMGSFRVADALTTLAFDYPRRGEFFQQELSQFLTLAKEEAEDPFTFKGSYAGAMGMPQFMPSSYREWAVDHDGDKHRDIWQNPGDTIASVANYLKKHGWEEHQVMVVPVHLSDNTNIAMVAAMAEEKTALNHTVAEMRKIGIVPDYPVKDSAKAMLFNLEVSPGVFEYYIGLNNFYTVWHYNHSRLYVKAVQELADLIKAGYLAQSSAG